MCDQDQDLSHLTVIDALERAQDEAPAFVKFVQGRLRHLILSVKPEDISSDSTAAIAREMQFLAGAMRNLVEMLVLFDSEAKPEPFEDEPS